MAVSFTDSKQNVWHVTLNIGNMRRIKEQLKIDLTTAMDSQEGFVSLLSNTYIISDILYVACMSQANERGITNSEMFGECLADGEAVQAAVDTLVRAIANFSTPQRKELLLRIWEKVKAVETAAIQEAQEKLESL